jgi:hypothetical protein
MYLDRLKFRVKGSGLFEASISEVEWKGRFWGSGINVSRLWGPSWVHWYV